MESIHHYPSPLGMIVITAAADALHGLWFAGQKHAPFAPAAQYEEAPLAIFDQTDRWLQLYFDGKEPGLPPALTVAGTPFQEAVWQILRSIPYGQTMTYGEIADRIARKWGVEKMSAQAVGGAVGRNPISLIIPCHRVIGANGSLTGYAGGMERKRQLLALESGNLKLFSASPFSMENPCAQIECMKGRDEHVPQQNKGHK